MVRIASAQGSDEVRARWAVRLAGRSGRWRGRAIIRALSYRQNHHALLTNQDGRVTREQPRLSQPDPIL